MSDFSNVIVPKKWGSEKIIYQSPKVEIWLLNIDKDAETSVHAHPNKKTALCVVGGCVKVNFLNNSVSLLPSEKINIHPNVFHQTECWSEQGAMLIEMESPPDKSNLVRMRDRYGRAGKPYETEFIERGDFSENLIVDKIIKVGECELEVYNTDDRELAYFYEFHSLFVLDGSLTCGGFPVIGVGDSTDPSKLMELIAEFGYKPLTLLGIRRC